MLLIFRTQGCAESIDLYALKHCLFILFKIILSFFFLFFMNICSCSFKILIALSTVMLDTITLNNIEYVIKPNSCNENKKIEKLFNLNSQKRKTIILVDKK
jgi:hypothetical protein